MGYEESLKSTLKRAEKNKKKIESKKTMAHNIVDKRFGTRLEKGSI